MLKDSIILTFSKGIRGILMLIFNMVIARLFSENLYGTYKHITLIVNLLTAICTFGIPTTISYYYSTYNKQKRNKLIGNTMIILCLISVVSGMTIILFQGGIANILNNPDLIYYINILAVYVITMIISSFLENLYISAEQSVLLGKIYILYTAANFIAMMITTLIFSSLYLLLIATVSIEVIRTIVMYILIRHKEKISFKIDLSMLMSQLKFAIPLGVVAIVQSINTYIDNIFISNSYTTEQYAAYANAAMDIPFVGIITVSVAAVILPKMSKSYNVDKDFKKVFSIWSDSCKKTAVIMFPIFWIAMLFSVGYIQLIFSQKYVASSTGIFMIYLIKFPLYCTVYGNILIVLGRQKYVMYNSIVGVALNIILNPIFLNIFGMSGPAIPTVIVQYTVVILQLIQISKYSKVKFKDLMPYKDLIKIFMIPAVIAIPMYIVCVIIGIPQWMGLIVGGLVIYIVTLGMYYKLNYIDRDIVEKIKKRGL